MPDISNYTALSDKQLADILETLSEGQVNDHRGIILLEAARRLRGAPDHDFICPRTLKPCEHPVRCSEDDCVWRPEILKPEGNNSGREGQ